MIYICVPAHNEATTVGLLLWKVRQVFAAFPREYQILVADDGSTDQTADVLEPYTRALPLTVLHHKERRGYAASIEALLRFAAERTDRPKRDSAILLHADFTHDPQFLPELVKRLESGADLVVGETRVEGEASRARYWLRAYGPLLLRGRVGIPGVRDVLSGYLAIRLVTLRHLLRDRREPLLTLDGLAANAELIGRVARQARRVDTVEVVERRQRLQRAPRAEPMALARALWAARGRLAFPAYTPPAPPANGDAPRPPRPPREAPAARS